MYRSTLNENAVLSKHFRQLSWNRTQWSHFSLYGLLIMAQYTKWKKNYIISLNE